MKIEIKENILIANNFLLVIFRDGEIFRESIESAFISHRSSIKIVQF